MSEKKELPMRLAMREEGDLWVAYCADQFTMDGAMFLGSIRIRFVRDPIHKAAFMNLMKEALSDIIEEVTGTRPAKWSGAHPAPEHERGGHG